MVKESPDEYRQNNVKGVIVLTGTGTDTQAGQDMLRAVTVCFVDGRFKFWRIEEPGPGRDGDRFREESRGRSQTVWYLGPDHDTFARVFGKFGVIVRAVPGQGPQAPQAR